MHDDEWLASTFNQISERLLIKDDLIVEIRGEVDPVIRRIQQPRPVPWAERALDEFALDIRFQKSLLEVLEQSVTKQAVIRGSKAAARCRRDQVHLVEHRLVVVADGAQRFHDAIREGGGACTATGEGQHHEEAIGILRA